MKFQNKENLFLLVALEEYLYQEMRRGSVGTMPVCAVPEMFKSIQFLIQGKHNEREYLNIFHWYDFRQGLGFELPQNKSKKKEYFSNAIAESCLKPDKEQINESDRMFDRLDLNDQQHSLFF